MPDRLTELEAEVFYWKNKCKEISEEYATFRANLKHILGDIDPNKKYGIIEEGGKPE